MIALVAREAVETLLENGVFAVPERQSKANHLVPVANAAAAVFSPAIGTRVSMFKGKELPGRSVCAVVFPDRAPLTLREIGAPALPMLLAEASLFKAAIFNG